jgi:hypothetical protein
LCCLCARCRRNPVRAALSAHEIDTG